MIALIAIAGVAPLANGSDKHRGKRFIWGGRADARSALYMRIRGEGGAYMHAHIPMDNLEL